MKSAYASAAAIASNTLTSIRTVMAFGGQQREVANYTAQLEAAQKVGELKSLKNGMGMVRAVALSPRTFVP